MYWQNVQGVNRTWDGGGVDGTCGGAGTANNWSCAANWSSDTAPTASDVAIFDGTSTKNATINANISVAGISINAGYTGTITQSSTFTVTVGSSHYSQAAGTFTGGSGTIDINGTFTLSGGTFTSTSGIFEVGRNIGSNETILTVSAGTFSHNNGTVKFNPSGNGFGVFTADISTTLTLYNIEVSNGLNFGDVITTGSGDTIIAINDFTHTNSALWGSWEVQGNVVIGSSADGGTGTLTMTGTGSKTYTYTASGIAAHLRINNAALAVTANTGTTALRTTLFSVLAGTFTAPTGTLMIGVSLTASQDIFDISSGATFIHNAGTVEFIPYFNSFATFYVNVDTTQTFYNVTINIGNNQSDVIATGSGDTITVANNFTHTNGKIVGTWQVQGNYTVATTADGGTAGITFTGGNNQTYTDQGGDEADGDVTINKTPGSSVTLKSNVDWNAGSQDVTITSGELNMGASSNISTTTLTVGTAGHLSNNGTGDLTLAGTLTNSGSIRFLGNGTCGGADDILIRSSSTGVQRSWNGTGSFTLQDVDVRDMAGSASITLYSSTSTANNGANWTFSGAGCPVRPPTAGLSTGKINMQSGKLQLQ